MFDLLRAAMRQRPEYILVGEVRGPEAQTLFQAMNTGHTTFSTMHAGSIDAAIHRLESEPLNVPRNMLQALNIISVQALIYRGTERVRRVQEVVEIVGIDQSTGNIQVNNVFVYDPIHDRSSYTGRSQVYAKMAEKRGWTRDQLDTEIAVRKNLLEEMHKYRPVWKLMAGNCSVTLFLSLSTLMLIQNWVPSTGTPYTSYSCSCRLCE